MHLSSSSATVSLFACLPQTEVSAKDPSYNAYSRMKDKGTESWDLQGNPKTGPGSVHRFLGVSYLEHHTDTPYEVSLHIILG